MKWLKRFFSVKNKSQRTADEVADYIHGKKNTFTGDMLKLKAQSKRLHRKALQTQEEAVKMNKVIEDITSKIVLVTPGGKNYGK